VLSLTKHHALKA